MTTAEAEWDETTRNAAMALEHYEASLCPCGCGHPAQVAQDGDNEFRFEVDGPYRCHARTALSKAREGQSEDVDAPDALLWSSRLKDD